MDAFFKSGIIDDAIIYLEHIPDEYVSGKEELVRQLKEKREAQGVIPQEKTGGETGMEASAGNPENMGQLAAKLAAI